MTAKQIKIIEDKLITLKECAIDAKKEGNMNQYYFNMGGCIYIMDTLKELGFDLDNEIDWKKIQEIQE